MTFRFRFQQGSQHYVLCSTVGAALPTGRRLSDSVAACVLARVLNDCDARELRRAYAELSGSIDLGNVSNAAILAWFSARLAGPIALLALNTETGLVHTHTESRIVQELAAAGISQLSYAGVTYQLADARAAVGGGFERVDARKTVSVLSAMAAEDSRPLPERDLLKAALAEIQQGGTLKLWRKRATPGSTRLKIPAPARQPAPAAPKTTWIEIELVDDSGAPVANQNYLVKLPDGSERRGKLNSKGIAALQDLPPGTCDVSFPGLKPRLM